MLLYIQLLLQVHLKPNCSNLALAGDLDSPYDFYKLLSGDDPSSHLEKLFKKRKKLSSGALLIDDVIVEVPYGKDTQGARWLYSTVKRKPVFGFQVVALVWKKGKRRIMLSYRVYSKGSKSKTALALELLSFARNSLKLKPSWVIFDAWYASTSILKRIKDYGWYFITQLRKNRNFDGKKLKHFKSGGYWNATGFIKSGMKVFVCKNVKKYFASNRLSLTRATILEIYKIRQYVEETFKQLKFLGLEGCQMRSVKAYINHISLVVFAYTFMERLQSRTGKSVYKLKKLNILRKETFSMQEIARSLGI